MRSLSDEEIWRTYDHVEQRLTAALSERMLDLARLGPGMRVLDLASGRGEPAIRAAHRVGPAGHVLGVDISDGVLAIARERAAREGLTNVSFQARSTASLDDLPLASFDATFARWGLMFLESPRTTLSLAARAMVQGGRLVAAVWAEPERVPYYTLPRQVLAHYAPVPAVDPDAPGTFYYAEPGRLREDLTTAGFVVEHEEEADVDVIEATAAVEIVAWSRAFGLDALLEGLPRSVQQAWEGDMVAALEALRENGRIRLGGVTRIVAAVVTR